MEKFLKRIFNFFKDYPGILYSFFLIIFIPIALYYNTFLMVKSFQDNVDLNFQTKALLSENIFSVFVSDFFSDTDLLQQKIKKITSENPEINNLRVMTEQKGGDFKIIASQNSTEVKGIISDPSLALSWSQDQTIANLVDRGGERFWKVIRPIHNQESGEKIGLISLSLSLQETDNLITNSIYRAYLIIIIVIVLGLFLIIQHTRLFGYVVLSNKLKEIDKMKDSFIRMATHELQSPITNIRAYVDVLDEEARNLLTEAQKGYLDVIKVSTKNLGNLISDILEVSRIEQGRLDFTPQKISPVATIKEAIKELQMEADKKKLEIALETAEEPFLINVNPNRFKQVLINLIVNSIKYTFKGKIEVRAAADKNKNKYIVSVSDTGIGIPAEAQQRLFEKFYRVKSRESAGVSGTGLGLWLTKQLCEKMKGEIFVESLSGVGSKFTVMFPLVKANQEEKKNENL